MTETAARIKDRKVYPGVVRPVSRRPDHGVDLELTPVLEARRTSARVDDAWSHLDAVAPLELARARADQGLSRAQPAPEPRFDGRVQEPGFRQPPEEVATEDSLGQ